MILFDKSEMNNLEKKAKAANYLKEGVLQFKNKKMVKGLSNIIYSIF